MTGLVVPTVLNSIAIIILARAVYQHMKGHR